MAERQSHSSADQVFWSTGSGLEFWNEGILRETLEASSKNDRIRSPVQQKIGDIGPPAWTRAESRLPG